MAIYINEPAHTFNEYLLIPGYSGYGLHSGQRIYQNRS